VGLRFRQLAIGVRRRWSSSSCRGGGFSGEGRRRSLRPLRGPHRVEVLKAEVSNCPERITARQLQLQDELTRFPQGITGSQPQVLEDSSGGATLDQIPKCRRNLSVDLRSQINQSEESHEIWCTVRFSQPSPEPVVHALAGVLLWRFRSHAGDGTARL